MKKFIIGFAFGALLFGGFTSEAASNSIIEIKQTIKSVFINGKKQNIENNVFVHNNTTYVPLRFVSESLGYNVQYNNSTKSISIGSGSSSTTASSKAATQKTATKSTAASTAKQSAASNYEKTLINLVNAERKKYGLSALKENATLNTIADVKAADMVKYNYFSHTSPTYGSPQNMIKRFGVNYLHSGENLAKHYDSPSKVMQGWMNSPGHRANILNKNYTQIGVSYNEKNDHWVQIFLKPAN